MTVDSVRKSGVTEWRRDILYECMSSEAFLRLTGWDIDKPIAFDSNFAKGPSTLRDLLTGTTVKWATQQQAGCSQDQAFYLIFDAIDELPWATLKLKAENCSKAENRTFPNDVDLDDILQHARKPFWSPVEAALLSLGIIPDDELLKHFSNMGHVERQITFDLIREYDERLELIRMKFSGTLDPEKINPAKALSFLNSRLFSLPENLVEAVSGIGNNSTIFNAGKVSAVKELKTLEKKSCLKIIGAMLSDISYSLKTTNCQVKSDELFKNFSNIYVGGNQEAFKKIIVDSVNCFLSSKDKRKSINSDDYSGELLLNVMGFLATDGYAHTRGDRSGTTKEILDLFYLQGDTIDRKTIKKFLDWGCKTLP